MVNKPIGKALAGVTVLLICLGLLFGLALDASHPANPITHVRPNFGAPRWRETQRVARQNETDVRQYEVLRAARTQASGNPCCPETRTGGSARDERDCKNREAG